MWRHALHLGRGFWRALLWLCLLLLLVLVPLLVMLGSETGSRWLLEQGLGMQKTLSARYESGSLLTGLELRDVSLRTSKMDLHVRHLLARWSLLQLFLGEVHLKTLEAEGIALKLTTPPTHKPTKLPLLVLPIRLVIDRIDLQEMSLQTWHTPNTPAHPLTLSRLRLAGQWKGYRLRVDSLQAEQEQIGTLELKGVLRLHGGWPLEATGQLDYKAFHEQGWQAVGISLKREVADLELQLKSAGPLTAEAIGRIKPLEPSLPYSADLRWQPVSLPWWPQQALASKGGQLQVSGDKAGLQSIGQAQLSGRQLPPGDYAWKGQTNWHSAKFESLNFNGLIGKVQAIGEVDWHDGVAWKASASFQNLNLARQWKVPPVVAPVMTGKLDSKGHTSKAGSALAASLRLKNGESWDVTEKGESWLWNLQASQEVHVQWREVSRALPGLETLGSEKGELELRGSRRDYSLLLNADAHSPRLPPGQWSAEISGAERHVNVERLDYEGEAGQLNVAGELDVGEEIVWQGALVLGNFSTAWLLPNWSGQFSGHATSRGRWGSTTREIQIEDSYLTGQLREQPVLVDGALNLELPLAGQTGWVQGWTPGLDMVWGTDKAHLQGGLRQHVWNLTSQLDLGALELFHPSLRGKLQGSLALQGEERAPAIQADLQGTRIGSPAFNARQARLQVNLPRLAEEDGHIVLDADGLVTSSGKDMGHLVLEAGGTRKAHDLQWRYESFRVQGNGSLSGTLGEEKLDWQGRMESGHISLPEMQWDLAEAFPLRWEPQEKALHLDPHCWVSGEARLCNREEMLAGPAGALHWRLEGLQAERLSGMLPDGLVLTGLIGGALDGGWQPGQHPLLTADLQATKGEVRLARDEPQPPLVLAYEHVGIKAEAEADRLSLHFGINSVAMGQGQIEVSLDPYTESHPLTGELSLKGLRLDVFQPFFPALSTLAGAVSAEGRLQGTLAKPEFWGDIDLAQGELGLHRLPVNIRDLTTHIQVKGNAADISGSMKSGTGSATLEGQANWAGERPELKLALKGERFELRQMPQLLAEIDPDLQLQVVPGQVDIGGVVLVPMGRLNLKPITDKSVALSSDVHIVTEADNQRLRASATTSNWVVNADILVRLGDDVFFHGYGVNGRLMGALRLRQVGRKGLEASGEVELDKDARYDAYGQRLLIRRGRLIFAGSLTQPGLDVEAVREVDSQVVGVRVEGRANAPEVSFFSDNGGLSQEEILSYLVLGRPLDTSSGKEGPNLSAAAAAIKLGATGGAGLTNSVGETLGITDLAVDAEGSGDDTQFTVSGYISPKLYLRYGVGIFTPVNTATIRYKINSRLYLEAVSSLDSAIDLFYNFKF